MTARIRVAETRLAFPVLKDIIDQALLNLIAGTDKDFQAIRTWIDSRELMICPLVERKHLVWLRGAAPCARPRHWPRRSTD